ncbi:right-handed parallel beta-helix repeat-containing protein [Robiginitalea sp. IMCC43444]|uniref:right-handed parallel beta-helix repeat-containing protein n=1 Tax=Robiginitalea sp. IMCC43444 TaxID=3459121 RepID=UPI00404260AE
MEVIVKKIDHGLILDSKENIWKNYRKVILLEGLKNGGLNLHGRSEIEANPITVRFNPYDEKEYLMVPFIDQENMELSNERFAFFTNEIPDTSLIISRTKNNLVFERKGKKYQIDRFIYLKDPLSKGYTVLPDLIKGNFKRIKSGNIKESESKERTKKKTFEQDFELIEDRSFEDMVINNTDQVTITLNGKANLFFDNCEIDFRKLKIIAMGQNAIIMRNCPKVIIDSVEISGISNYTSDSFTLPSGLTFIKSNVTIRNSTFFSNITGDDFVNFYASQFSVDATMFKDIPNDAIDSDFSEGTISNSNFLRIGNDGVDFSGSDILLENNVFTNVGDKCISAGEYSNVESNNNKMVDSSIGLVVKDGSVLETEKDSFAGNTVDIAVFMKKDFYNDPLLIYNDVLNEKNYLIEKKSYVIPYFDEKITITKKVEDLMYGNLYGKASKR